MTRLPTRSAPDPVAGRPDRVAGLKRRAAAELGRHQPELLALSHAIHADPELSWDEHRASAWVADLLECSGFAVTRGAYGVPIAVEGNICSGHLTAVLYAEYDAMPGVGHGCGHNMIAAGVGAALALASVADEAGFTVRLLGTPAEERGGARWPC